MAAAAPNPKFNFNFESGAPSAANLNAASGNPLLVVDPTHWLYVVSGGALPASAVVVGSVTIPWLARWSFKCSSSCRSMWLSKVPPPPHAR